MILDLARLLLFPPLIAFAGASDLFTMTNLQPRLDPAGGGLLRHGGGERHAAAGDRAHAGAGLTVLAAAFVCFAMGWVGGGDAKVPPPPRCGSASTTC